tara:strand:+ start:212 stop:370 length:159 start_codon:yes stop_codon:yes gene_type:complete
MNKKYEKIIKPKSNKQSSSNGGKKAAKNNPKTIDVETRRKDANKNWPWWIPK